ncbi:MAG: taurine catabolism dioxygenase TauD, partial [Gammaproteobacteria bacterium]|nr:taurine catabolism dioxygenase TauD [Gammaproteobacteria bacterium]
MNELQFSVSPLEDSSFGAVVTDVKLSEIDDETFQALYTQWLEYALLIFPGQHLTNAEQIIFAKRFGDLEFDLAPITNVDKDGNVHFDPTEDRV